MHNRALRLNDVQRVLVLSIPIGVIALLAACAGGSTQPQKSTQATSLPPTAAPTRKASSNEPKLPQACALLTVADVQKITGYGGGLADSQDIGEGATNCTILAAQGKFKVELGVGKGVFPVLPTQKQVDLEGGAKGIVKDSGIGQGWMSLVQFSDYSATLIFGGTAATLDPDKKVANVTKADGGVITYAQAYEALARAVAHNAATGAQLPGGVSDVGKKDDPCALLTLDEVKQAMTGFTVTGPDSSPSAFGGNTCRFRGQSDSLKATAIVGVVYLTQQQFEQAKAMGTAKRTDIGGVTAFDLSAGLGGLILLNKGNRYVRFSIDANVGDSATMEKLGQGLRAWMPQLAGKISARLK